MCRSWRWDSSDSGEIQSTGNSRSRIIIIIGCNRNIVNISRILGIRSRRRRRRSIILPILGAAAAGRRASCCSGCCGSSGLGTSSSTYCSTSCTYKPPPEGTPHTSYLNRELSCRCSFCGAGSCAKTGNSVQYLELSYDEEKVLALTFLQLYNTYIRRGNSSLVDTEIVDEGKMHTNAAYSEKGT